ncbi:lipase class 3 [Nitzschia inconspicua]|uniref:Lipase class 3 n=1 Tax=Nitzschia inconspicua TaxID=303405 RepID=A0A9K3PP69_9STRA|nr:lipase class 3 [Nitzschia inconspicua]
MANGVSGRATRKLLHTLDENSFRTPFSTANVAVASYGYSLPRKTVRPHLFSSLACELTLANVSCVQKADDFSWPSVYDESREMMMAAHMSYPLSFLIREAKQGNLKQSDQVLQVLQSVRDGDLSTALSPQDIMDIIKENKDYLLEHRTSDMVDEFGSVKILEHWDSIARQYGSGSLSLLEFDDHYDKRRLCYAILINKMRRRITVVFRGTYADGTNDWKRNLQIEQTEIPVPFNLQNILKDQDGNPMTMRVHKGLYEYLFRNNDRGPRFETERYQDILKHLQTCLEGNPGFKIYVTGHSAGGALAKLFAFYLSTSRKALHIPKPVTCICIGSLVMGDSGYSQAVSCVERLGWLRHLSIKNEGDIICYTPPLHWYAPSGMHLRLHRHGGLLFWHPSGPGMQKYHDNTLKSMMRIFRSALTRRVDLLSEHLVPCYLRRLEAERETLSQLTLSDLYHDPDLIYATHHPANHDNVVEHQGMEKLT